MDVEHLVTPRPAPCAVLDHVATRGDRVRFRVRQPDGSWQPVTWRSTRERSKPPRLSTWSAGTKASLVVK